MDDTRSPPVPATRGPFQREREVSIALGEHETGVYEIRKNRRDALIRNVMTGPAKEASDPVSRAAVLARQIDVRPEAIECMPPLRGGPSITDDQVSRPTSVVELAVGPRRIPSPLRDRLSDLRHVFLWVAAIGVIGLEIIADVSVSTSRNAIDGPIVGGRAKVGEAMRHQPCLRSCARSAGLSRPRRRAVHPDRGPTPRHPTGTRDRGVDGVARA